MLPVVVVVGAAVVVVGAVVVVVGAAVVGMVVVGAASGDGDDEHEAAPAPIAATDAIAAIRIVLVMPFDSILWTTDPPGPPRDRRFESVRS
jgi:hypothetical protein